MPTSYQNLKYLRTFHPKNWKPNWFLIPYWSFHCISDSNFRALFIEMQAFVCKSSERFRPSVHLMAMSALESYGTAGPSLNESITGFNFARTNGLEETFRFRVFFLWLVWWLVSRCHCCPFCPQKLRILWGFFSEKAWVSWKFQCSHHIQSGEIQLIPQMFSLMSKITTSKNMEQIRKTRQKLPCLYATWGNTCPNKNRQTCVKKLRMFFFWWVARVQCNCGEPQIRGGPTLGSTAYVIKNQKRFSGE